MGASAERFANVSDTIRTIPPRAAIATEERSFEPLRETFAFVMSSGQSWLAANEMLVRQLPTGTVIAIHLASGAHVLGKDGLDAMDHFVARFGKEAVAWVHEVGVPVRLGGGLWPLSSGA
jgi:hypothetical protein